MVTKPTDVFARDWEWEQLNRFVSIDRSGAVLGVVSGRRRQGKTFLLEALTEATGGFMFSATEAVPAAEALRQLAHQIAEFRGLAAEPRYENWEQAVGDLLSLGKDRAIPVVIDEFPYLVAHSPELPSVIQKVLSPRSRSRRESSARLLLCGSSVAFMGRLLSGSAPLRGRAALELVISTFDFRLARQFWEIGDLRLAALTYFVVGGTPAYRGEYLPDVRVSTFDLFIVDNVLNPASPMFREVRALLAEDPALKDAGMYHAVLAAVADGNCTRGRIANRLDRKATDIAHHLTVLEDSGFLVREDDAFRSNRSQFRIVEPMVRFYHSIMRPKWAQLERVRPGRTERIWSDAQQSFRSQVAGPGFEWMCHSWVEDFAGPDDLGSDMASVRSGVVYDESQRKHHELDVVVRGAESELIAIGEAKWGDVIGMAHLERLEHVSSLLTARGERLPRLLLFSGTGFMPKLIKAAEASNGRIQLVGLERLYGDPSV